MLRTAIACSLAVLAGCEMNVVIAESDAALDARRDGGGIDGTPTGVAFHGIEGYGRTVRGGRMGQLYEVTTLATSGPGSLADAVSGDYRIVVFRVSGYIDAGVTIRGSHITIAGQTAPGGGITIRGGGLSCADGISDIIIRFIKVRPGYTAGVTQDAIGCRFTNGLVIDHVSTSWATDENLSVYGNELVSVQWSIAAEALSSAGHSWGGLWGGDRATFHHNLLASNATGNPDLSGATLDIRNNVVYNWSSNYAAFGGVDGLNLVNNYFKPGPSTPAAGARSILWASAAIRGFIGGNTLFGAADITSNNDLGVIGTYTKLTAEINMQDVWTDSAADTLTNVLQYAGDCLHRDAVDLRIINDVKNGTGKIIERENDVGGWPVLAAGTLPVDTDHDGVPDDMEKSRGTDPNDSSDGPLDDDNDGYTNVEEYLQGLAGWCYPRW